MASAPTTTPNTSATTNSDASTATAASSTPETSTSSTSNAASEVTIRELNSSITTFSLPFLRAGAEVGVRMSAIKVNNNELVLYNPTLLDEQTKTKLQSLGTVKYVVAPNLVHHVFLDPYHVAYPEAKIIGPEGLPEKHKDKTPFNVEMKDPKTDYNSTIGWGSDMDYIYFPDFAQKEIMLFHHPTKTLFVADMFYSLPATEAYTNVSDKSRQPINAEKKGFGSIGLGVQNAVDHHLGPEGFLGKALNWIANKVTDDFKAGMKKLFNDWKPTVIVMEHGDVIEKEAEEKLKHAYSWVKWDK